MTQQPTLAVKSKPSSDREGSKLLESLIAKLSQIRDSLINQENELRERIMTSHTASKKSVANLIHYLAFLTNESIPGRPAQIDSNGRTLRPASISCTLPEVLSQVRTGERIWFDDGKIGGIVRALVPKRFESKSSRQSRTATNSLLTRGLICPTQISGCPRSVRRIWRICDLSLGMRAWSGCRLCVASVMLDNILRRMQGHQSKKSSRLRRLHLSAKREADDT